MSCGAKELPIEKPNMKNYAILQKVGLNVNCKGKLPTIKYLNDKILVNN